MSAGISRSRLMEERKQWRKDHPHVNQKQAFCQTPIYLLFFNLGLLGTTWKER